MICVKSYKNFVYRKKLEELRDKRSQDGSTCLVSLYIPPDRVISDFVADFRAATPSAAAELVIPERSELEGRVLESRDRLYTIINSQVETLKAKVDSLRKSYVLREPINFLLQLEQSVDELARRADTGITHIVELKNNDLVSSSGKLEVLSPLAVLNRGYSITFKNGKVIKKAKQIKCGQEVTTRLAEGELISRVEKTN